MEKLTNVEMEFLIELLEPMALGGLKVDSSPQYARKRDFAKSVYHKLGVEFRARN